MFLRYFRFLIVFAAIAGYAANGAQTHLAAHAGDTFSIPLCGAGTGRTITLTLGEEAPVETSDETCCGDCVVAAAVLPPNAPSAISFLRVAPVSYIPLGIAISPRSPLWPGAPPHGPPFS